EAWLLTNWGSRPIASAHARKFSAFSENGRLGFIGNAPILRRSSEAPYEHDRWRSFAATFQVHLAPAADVHQPCEVWAFRANRYSEQSDEWNNTVQRNPQSKSFFH